MCMYVGKIVVTDVMMPWDHLVLLDKPVHTKGKNQQI